MYVVFEYIASLFVWFILLGIVFIIIKQFRIRIFCKLRFVDIVLVALFFNAAFYLIGIKVIDIFYIRLQEIKYASNEPWGIIVVEYFFDKIINWVLIILTVLFLALHRGGRV